MTNIPNVDNATVNNVLVFKGTDLQGIKNVLFLLVAAEANTDNIAQEIAKHNAEDSRKKAYYKSLSKMLEEYAGAASNENKASSIMQAIRGIFKEMGYDICISNVRWEPGTEGSKYSLKYDIKITGDAAVSSEEQYLMSTMQKMFESFFQVNYGLRYRSGLEGGIDRDIQNYCETASKSWLSDAWCKLTSMNGKFIDYTSSMDIITKQGKNFLERYYSSLEKLGGLGNYED